MAIIGTPRFFDQKWAFRLQVDGFLSAEFSKCSALEAEVKEVKHAQGGSMLDTKSAGRVEYKDITLERGASRLDFDAYAWFTSVVNAPANAGLAEPLYKRHADLIQYDRTGAPIKIWSLIWCWPKSFTAGEWDNSADEVVIEKLTLAYDMFFRRL